VDLEGESVDRSQPWFAKYSWPLNTRYRNFHLGIRAIF